MIFKRLKDLREDNDYTQQQIADMLYINRRTYSSYETGMAGLPVEILIKLADIYNTSTDYILERTDEK
ncbi:MAG: helix-turn-helix transcriptional regulator [Oscillospiraceae bacterium]|nr:helix-turn-helix transcriptional regulator [Oscillospiraceae bacterium]